MSNELVEREPNNAPAVASESVTILSIIQHAASSPEVDIDKMERLLVMHERMQSRQAETAYSEALSAMQIVLPEIKERGGIKNREGKTQSTYALWEDINDAIKPVLSEFGFALSFRIDSSAGIKVTGVLSHKAGHKEMTDILLPADVSGSKNNVQAIASSVSYGKRYTAGALLNLTSRGEDDDGKAAGQRPQNEKKKPTLNDVGLGKAIASIKAGTYSYAELTANYELTRGQIDRVEKEIF